MKNKNELQRIEAKRTAFLSILASADFLELLQFSKDVSMALNYRAKMEETILTAQKYMNGGVA